MEAVREEEVKLREGVGFVEEAGFKPRVKESAPSLIIPISLSHYGCTEW